MLVLWSLDVKHAWDRYGCFGYCIVLWWVALGWSALGWSDELNGLCGWLIYMGVVDNARLVNNVRISYDRCYHATYLI